MIAMTMNEAGLGVQELPDGNCMIQVVDDHSGIQIRIPIPKEGRDAVANAIRGGRNGVVVPKPVIVQDGR